MKLENFAVTLLYLSPIFIGIGIDLFRRFNKIKKEKEESLLETQRLNDRIHLSEEQKFKLEEEKDKLQSEIKEAYQLQTQKDQEISRLEERLHHLEENLKTTQEQKEEIGDKLKNEFQEIMFRLLKEREGSISKSNKETLAPIREDLKLFKEQIQETYIREREQRTSLQNEIKNLMERSQELSKDAQQLALALKGDSKTQGNWGEMILESILERSGLIKDENYEIQKSISDEEGKTFRPDVIVKYPDSRFIIIDSKVSLSAYIDYVNAEDEDARNQALKRHLTSIQKHIDELDLKSYCDKLGGSPDFVLMFIPNEPAYNIAMQTDHNLWEKAYQKRIILINATNLIAALRMVLDMWRRDKQIKNVDQITKKAADMYDKFAIIEESFSSVERSLLNAQENLNKTKNQLLDGRGNLKRRMEELKDMGGLQTKKQLKSSEL